MMFIRKSGDGDEQRVFAALVLTDTPRDLVAVKPGHCQIEQHHIRMASAGYLDAFLTSVTADDLCPVSRKSMVRESVLSWLSSTTTMRSADFVAIDRKSPRDN
jgi:hypothetical protein